MNPNDRSQFELRKRDHLEFALQPEAQSNQPHGLNRVVFFHEALPDKNYSEVHLQRSQSNLPVWKQSLKSPHFVSSMTAGHAAGFAVNRRLAMAAQKQGWMMGVGSQRRELSDVTAQSEWLDLRQECPETIMISNIGITQLLESTPKEVLALPKALGASALFVHTNPLQEVIQKEGTPHFRGTLGALTRLVDQAELPIILKETGCGFSARTLQRLNGIGLYAVDVAGAGGTNWGKVEGLRSPLDQASGMAWTAEVFRGWGSSTFESLYQASQIELDFELWASGGIRSGLDSLKCLALGAQMVGIAAPLMKAALDSQEKLEQMMTDFDEQLRIGLFLTGCATLEEFEKERPWEIQI